MPEALSDQAVLAHCRRTIQLGSRSFAGAAALFDPRTRAAAYMLYAWCRHCDDQIDGETLGFRHRESTDRARRLRELERRTLAALRGQPDDDPVFRALHHVAERHGIPERYPLELLEGFGMDVVGRRYRELPELLLYCYHVAGVVGLMMAHIMQVREEATLRRAADLGIALQMTNIARDVVEDAAAGRVYLPQAWLEERRLREVDLQAPGRRDDLAVLVRRLLEEADHYYASGGQGLPRLSLRSAWAVAVARGVYSEIGRRVLERGERAWDTRTVVGRARKLAWVARGFVEATHAVSFGRRAASPRAPRLWTKGEPGLGDSG